MKRVIILPLTVALALLVLFQLPTAPTAHATPLFSPAYSDASAVFFNSTTTGLVDQTAAASNPFPSDVQLGGNINEAHIVGSIAAPFTSIAYNITSGGTASGGVQWQYWNGILWKQFPTVVDSTGNFTQFPGIFFVNFTSPSSPTLPRDWSKTTIPPTRKGTLAFYARALTVSPYVTLSVPKAAQLSILVLPVSKVEITVNLWDGTGVPDANVSLWAAGDTVPRKTLTASVSGGTYDFTPADHRLTNGQQFTIRVAKFGFQNLTAPASGFFTYDSTLSLNQEGPVTLHGSLQLRVFRAFPPSTPIPSTPVLPVTGIVTNKTSGFFMTAVANATGVVEFPVDWRSSGLVNVTIGKPGWLTSFSKNVTLAAWTTTSITVRLQTTVRVNALTELGFPIPGANVTVRDSSQNILLATFDGSALDQDSNSTDGIVYLALDPASIPLTPTPTFSITVSRPGLSNYSVSFAVSSLMASSTTQVIMASANKYGIKVTAWDELNNALTLSKSDTGFAGLSNVQVDYSGGTAYMAADPASPGVLTISKTGYVSTTTTSIIRPPSPIVFSIQTITYRPSTGTGPGLPFTVKVVGVFNELGKPFQIGAGGNATITPSSGSFVISSGNAYLAANAKVNVTASSPGYVTSTFTATLTPSSQTRILFNNTGTGGVTLASGLKYSVKVVGVFNELGNQFQLNSNATITSSTGTFTVSSGNGYLAATTKISVAASSSGYVNATALNITPTALSQATLLFKNGGNVSGLQFAVKVVGVYNELGSKFQLGTNATITSSAGTFILNSGNEYLATAAKINVTASSPGYVNATALNITPTAVSQTTILFKNGGSGSTIIKTALQFTVKVASVSDELGNLIPSASVTVPGTTAVVSGSSFYFAITGSTAITLTATATGYVTTTAPPVTPSMSSQTTVTLPGLPFTVKVVGIADQFGKTLSSTPSVSAPGVTPVLKTPVFYFALAPSAGVNLVAAAPGYVNATVAVTPSNTSQSTVTFGIAGSSATVKGPGLPFTLKVNVVQSWDSSPVQGATVGVYSDSAFTTLLTSAMTDSSGNVYLPASPALVYLQVSLSSYATYKSAAVQLSSAQQTSSSVSFTAKTSSISASGTTVSVTANTNISSLSFNSANNTISLTSTSPSAGNVNVTIPQSLIPSGSTIKVTSGGQTVTYKTTSDANNVYVQIPTASGTNNLQVAFSAPPSPAQSLLIPIAIAVVIIAGIAVAGYALLRRRKTVPKTVAQTPAK